ncbi:MAG: hypothetical protein ACKVOB_07160 [Sphingomonas sp.]
MSKNTVFTILAIIGGLVVFGWLLKLTFALFGPLLLVGLGVVVYLAVSNNKRIGGPK